MYFVYFIGFVIDIRVMITNV